MKDTLRSRYPDSNFSKQLRLEAMWKHQCILPSTNNKSPVKKLQSVMDHRCRACNLKPNATSAPRLFFIDNIVYSQTIVDLRDNKNAIASFSA
jgi:hypothetical protein